VKLSLDFSHKTYEAEVAKLNQFLSHNTTVAAIEKNAAKSGYQLLDLTGYSPMNNQISSQIGGSGAKDCDRWIFDEAKEDDISKLYEAGRNNDHLLVACVKKTNKKGYLPWDNAQVKEYLTLIVKQQKKAEKALALTKNVKSIADMQRVKGAIVATLNAQTFANYATVTGINIPEAKLSGVIAKTAKGQCSKVVAGAAAAYIVKVTNVKTAGNTYDEASEMDKVAMMYAQGTFQNVLNYLEMREADITDHRYRF